MMTRRFATKAKLRLAGIALLACGPVGLSISAHAAPQAQDDIEESNAAGHPVVQPVPQAGGGQSLNAALSRLARDPRNVSALIDAGDASRQLGDMDAAIGFYTRAADVDPGDGRVKARIAATMVQNDNPIDAIRLFDEAERAGADVTAMGADRGLAYDLAGDNANAQRWYQVALSRGANEDATMRYAISLAIAGDRRGAEGVLAPMIQRQDRAAWRVRTFVMAITGNAEEAVAIAHASMPQDLAAGIAPYLRYMPRLTAAQQAAAANLGRFPRAADIGRDDARVVEYAALHPRAPRADAGLIPAGDALGGKGRDDRASRDKRRRSGRDVVQVASASQPAVTAPWGVTPPPPPPVAASTVTTAPVAPVSARVAVAPQPPTPSAPPVKVAVAPSVPTSPPSASSSPSATAGFDLARVSGRGASTALPVRSVLDGPAPAAPASSARVAIAPAQAPVAPVVAARPVAPATVAVPVVQPVPAAPASVQIARAEPVVPAAAEPAPVAVAVPASAAAAPPPAANFQSLFDGFTAPQDEQRETVAAVDIASLRHARPKPPEPVVVPEKDAKAKDAKAKADPRGERPDGPTDVSRTSERDPKVKGGKDAKAKDSLKDAKDPKAKDAKDAKGKGKDAKGKEAKPTHPSRIWVQVLTGGTSEMNNEWRKLAKQAPDAFKGHKPFVSQWRANFRLLTGPFESDAAAQEFVARLRKAGVGGFQWTSPAGQAVDPMALK